MDTTSTPGVNDVKSSQPYKQFRNGMDNLSDKVKDLDVQGQYDMIKERATDAYDTSVDFIKKYPVSALLGATAIGYIAGVLARRR